MVLVGIPAALWDPRSLLGGGASGLGLAFLAMLLWPWAEAASLTRWSTTPGKVVLGLAVHCEGGGHLSYPAALRRSYSVWLHGLGCGIPVLNFAASLNEYFRLRRSGAAYWEPRWGRTVQTSPFTAGVLARAALATIVVTSAFAPIQYLAGSRGGAQGTVTSSWTGSVSGYDMWVTINVNRTDVIDSDPLEIVTVEGRYASEWRRGELFLVHATYDGHALAFPLATANRDITATFTTTAMFKDSLVGTIYGTIDGTWHQSLPVVFRRLR
jgi:uncharacterized RDD family membrane protein YckC